MFEVELKAHVYEREKVIEKLNSFAEYLGNVQKDDVYWKTYKNEKKVKARIRTETNLEDSTKKIFLTYKKKECRFDENGKSYEVNDEKECELSDSITLEALFKDLGMIVFLKKQKIVLGWQFEEIHIELCTVPPLGDFLEIEIISNTNDEKTVSEKREKLISILKKCEIPEKNIENRYYSDMLKNI